MLLHFPGEELADILLRKRKAHVQHIFVRSTIIEFRLTAGALVVNAELAAGGDAVLALPHLNQPVLARIVKLKADGIVEHAGKRCCSVIQLAEAEITLPGVDRRVENLLRNVKVEADAQKAGIIGAIENLLRGIVEEPHRNFLIADIHDDLGNTSLWILRYAEPALLRVFLIVAERLHALLKQILGIDQRFLVLVGRRSRLRYLCLRLVRRLRRHCKQHSAHQGQRHQSGNKSCGILVLFHRIDCLLNFSVFPVPPLQGAKEEQYHQSGAAC